MLKKALAIPLRLLYALWYIPLFVALTLAAGAVALIGSLFSATFTRVVSGQIWGSVVLGPAFILLKARGRELLPPLSQGGFILFANHRSLLDIPAAAMAAERPLSWVAKAALGKIPVFGWVLKRSHMLVEREGGSEAARKMIAEATERLRAGEIMAIFPEGTRNKSAAPLLPFKKGAFILAKHVGVPLVPLAIYNSGELWPPRRYLPRPGVIKVAIGRPLAIEPKESLNSISQRAHEALWELYQGLAREEAPPEESADGAPKP
ncbi:MAG: 1-acyl-sn-glycerol-3-phosphate acyltransferase [Deltaproteobacteria bacterium]|nr:1-acyl-sn-glycerol-3-phosphate acyltransferase [Deltaproteobacteria bacterium]